MADSLCLTGLPICAKQAIKADSLHHVSNPKVDCPDCPANDLCGSQDYHLLILAIGHGQDIYGWLTVSVPVEFADDPEERSLLMEMARDLGFSLHTMKVAQKEAKHSGMLVRRQAAQETITAMSARLLQCLPEEADPVIEQILADLTRFSGADRSYLFRFSSDGVRMNNTHEWCMPGTSPQKDALQDLPVDDFPWWMDRMDRGESVFIPLVQNLPLEARAERTVLEAQGIRSLLVLPMSQGRKFGYLGLDWVRRSTDLDPELVPMLQLAANLLQNAIARMENLTALRQQEEAYRLLVENQNDLVVKLDRKGRFEFVSPSYGRLFGMREDALLGQHFYPLVNEAGSISPELMHGLKYPPHTSHQEQQALTVKGLRWLDWMHTGVPDGQSEIAYIVSAGRDITERKDAEHQLEKTLEDVIDLLGRVVEHRDPYTSGHQKRVAELARNIAQQMDLPAQKLTSVYMGGLIHDLGKIAVPAEILSKPGKLASYEYTLIQQHPLTGFDIIRNLRFPWDIAQMVLQHHEKFDGSGYPNGLQGDQILLEARILCVADVVEAMSTHRPYRPALGMHAALDEITKQAGKLYDPVVAAACVAFIKTHGFEFGATSAPPKNHHEP